MNKSLHDGNHDMCSKNLCVYSFSAQVGVIMQKNLCPLMSLFERKCIPTHPVTLLSR